MLGRVVELINGHDGKTRGVKINMGKTKTVISRPVNKVYALELAKIWEQIIKIIVVDWLLTTWLVMTSSNCWVFSTLSWDSSTGGSVKFIVTST